LSFHQPDTACAAKRAHQRTLRTPFGHANKKADVLRPEDVRRSLPRRLHEDFQKSARIEGHDENLTSPRRRPERRVSRLFNCTYELPTLFSRTLCRRVYFSRAYALLRKYKYVKEPDLIDRSPVCPTHRKAMIPIDTTADTHYRCGRQECPIHWNPTDILFYLKTRGDWPVRENNEN